MKTRERSNTELAGRQTADGGPENADLDQLRRQGTDFLNEAERAIRNALSIDSEKFLTANRQHGGQ